ncbi:MAG: hypothetical protein ACK58N_02130 [Synechocystis sp.]|jgi:hypothetical protein
MKIHQSCTHNHRRLPRSTAGELSGFTAPCYTPEGFASSLGVTLELSFQERMESVKAGLTAAIAFGGVYGLALVGNHYFGLTQWPDSSLWPLGLNLGSSLLSGFLFGVTYRYIIRRDDNSHLRDGAVLAFALVRSGGLIELQPGHSEMVGAIALLMLESLVGFAAARSSLDLAMGQQWLKPFGD